MLWHHPHSPSGSGISFPEFESVGYWELITESSRNCLLAMPITPPLWGFPYPLTGWCSPFVLILVNLEESSQLYRSLQESAVASIATSLQFNFTFASLTLSHVSFPQTLPNYLWVDLHLNVCVLMNSTWDELQIKISAGTFWLDKTTLEII